jgi:hypothetical protein
MKVLTVKQPWADLIVNGLKPIKNSTWKTNFRGRIMIHAASTYDKEAVKIFQITDIEEWITSAIIGEVDIVDCVRDYPSIWADPDLWNWVLRNPEEYDAPILEINGESDTLWEYSDL